jgi:Nucleotidyl transferase AbiEii toxin, Type IV TA system
MSQLSPKPDILPEQQQELWPHLRPLAQHGFVLYAGTAIALRLGHRISVNFNFFNDRPLDRNSINDALPWLKTATVLQDDRQTHVVLTQAGVKLSLFGSIGFGRTAAPQWTDDGAMVIAAPDDLLATKLKVVLQRAEAKNYIDVAALLGAGLDLEEGLGQCCALFPDFQPGEALKALTYFGDGDLATVPQNARTILADAVRSVRRIPVVPVLSRILSIDP